MIKDPKLGRITQGSIFCGGIAEDYPHCPVWGLVITARCDTAHEKVPVVNYLPIVRIEDWINCHGAFILVDRLIGDLQNKLKNLLTKKELSDSLLAVHTPAKILEKHFPRPPSTTNPTKKDQADLRDHEQAYRIVDELSHAEAAYANNNLTFKKVCGLSQSQSVEGLANRLLSELISGQLAGYYFLRSIGTTTEHPSALGYVALLREIHHIPRSVVPVIIKGAERNDVLDSSQGNLSFAHFDFLYPVAEITSPWIEHLMQVFCNLFGRIGIADADKAHATVVVNACK